MTLPCEAEGRTDLNILFVDDDETFATLVRKRLALRGHTVETVANGDAALARIAGGGVDVVALDHSLRGETGFDIMERMGPRGPRPPIVYVTADSDARTAVAALRGGADEYVVKEGRDEFFDLLSAAIEHVYERWRLKILNDEQEQAVREARDRAEMLLHEVNHRVANSLGLIAAMVRMQANLVTDPAAAQALQETQARITAVGGVHRRLYMHNRVGLVALDDYLGALATELPASLAEGDAAPTVRTEFAPITVCTDKAVSIGMIVGELVTNAIKYAYPDRAGGEIRITLQREADDGAALRVADDGVGFDPDDAAHGAGLGSKILKALSQNLQGEIVNEPVARGACVCLRFKLDARDSVDAA
ncbi:two-component sensor histidine kinase [Rhodoblastus acidophilus]|uniref:sensor histidine kinase n=1 Tax=Rhodoblastus acidophilus TaxID=1074 RepID=UPI002225190C|nr:response regulator [Rhodoblastus acidophilus]MCW2315470.1 two-component sensor histidine kinase [Rhodoblastus acidophilus]